MIIKFIKRFHYMWKNLVKIFFGYIVYNFFNLWCWMLYLKYFDYAVLEFFKANKNNILIFYFVFNVCLFSFVFFDCVSTKWFFLYLKSISIYFFLFFFCLVYYLKKPILDNFSFSFNLIFNNIFSTSQLVTFYFDDNSLVFFLLIFSIYFFSSLFSYYYLFFENNNKKFFFFLGFFALSMVGLVLSHTVVSIFFFWEMIGLSSFFLIGYYNTKIGAFKSALKALIVNKISDVLFLGCIAIYWFNYKTFYILQDSSLIINSFNYDFFFFKINSSLLFITLMTTVCFIKSAQFIFFYWLLDSMDAPVPASALIHSATLVTAGIYIMYRFKLFYSFFSYFSEIVVLFCLLTSCFSGLCAAYQTDLKKLLAYSTISNCSLLIVLVLSSNSSYFFFYLTAHGLIKSFLFLCVGYLFFVNKHQQDHKFLSSFKNFNIIYYIIFFFFFCLSAAPFFFLFDFKHILFQSKHIFNSVFFFNKYILLLSFLTSFFYSVNFVTNFTCYLQKHKKKNSTIEFLKQKNKNSITNQLLDVIFFFIIFIVFILVFYYKIYIENFNINLEVFYMVFHNQYFFTKFFNFFLLCFMYVVWANFSKKKINYIFFFFLFFVF